MKEFILLIGVKNALYMENLGNIVLKSLPFTTFETMIKICPAAF